MGGWGDQGRRPFAQSAGGGEDTLRGGAISAVAATESPIIFIGTGEHFDEFETFEARAFVSRLLGMGDMKGLMETFVETGVLDNQEEVVKKFAQGQFSLRDMREQFSNVMKMGNLSQVVSMIPGMSFLMPKGKEREGENNIQMFMTIMDSMSEDELVKVANTHRRGPLYALCSEKLPCIHYV